MDRIAAVSGGSSGIGLEICRMLLKGGYKVYELSRRGGDCGIHICTDITDEDSVKAAFAQIEKESGRLDLLINNAGCGISGAIEFTPVTDAKRQFDVNFFGMFTCVKYTVPLMRANGGRIVNVSSAAAIFSIPFQAFYSASKAAINSLTLALSNELKPFGISVCAVMPGDVRTGFTDMRKKLEEGDEIYGGVIAPSVAVMEKDERGGMTPEQVAGVIVRIAGKKHVRPLYTAGALYKLYSLIAKLLPTFMVNKIVGAMYIKKQ